MSNTEPIAGVTIATPHAYSEATWTVHAGRLSGDVGLIAMGTRTGWLRPLSASVDYHWRGQLGDSDWDSGSLKAYAEVVTDDGTPHPSYVDYPNTTLILHDGMPDVPEWMREFARRCRPIRRLVVGTVGEPTNQPERLPELASGVEPMTIRSVRLEHVSRSARIRHVLQAAAVTGAPVAVVPDYSYPWKDRHIRPDLVSAEYTWRAGHSDVNPAPQWTVGQISVTGPWIDADGGPVEHSGRGAAPVPPAWAADYAQRHLPHHVCLA